MRKLALICSAAAILSMPLALFATDEKPVPQKKKARTIAELKVIEQATVKAVDMKKRMVTLELADGSLRELVVDNRVKKLDKVEVGDTVKVNYKEAITVRLKKTRVEPNITVEETAARDKDSVKPAGSAKRQVTVIATIEKIFDDGKSVTLKSPNGNTIDARVTNPENLAKIKKGEVKEGDQVEITYTQALAIAVEKVSQPEKK